MHKIILFIILLSVILPFDLKVNVNPDTIFVGSLVNIIFTVESNTNNEIVIFYDIEEDVDNYTVINKKLYQNSVDYTLQFWNEGDIIIPPIPVDIKNNNQNLRRIKAFMNAAKEDGKRILMVSNLMSGKGIQKKIEEDFVSQPDFKFNIDLDCDFGAKHFDKVFFTLFAEF